VSLHSYASCPVWEVYLHGPQYSDAPSLTQEDQRQKAKRDSCPTGLNLSFDPAWPNSIQIMAVSLMGGEHPPSPALGCFTLPW
jgi:hypothetical protein